MTPPEMRADFPAHPTSAGLARRFVDQTLSDWSCGHFVDVATLLVSELVGNAILHAGTTIEVVIRREQDRLRIEVHDGNVRLPTRKLYSQMSATGRGLVLVERMSHDWGSQATGSGKFVWFELDQTAPDPDGLGIWDVAELDFDLEGLGPAGRSQAGDDDLGSTDAEKTPRLRASSGARPI